MRCEIALRFSGRLNVSVASWPVNSSVNVSNIFGVSLRMILIHKRGVCILCANFVGHAKHDPEPRGINPRIGARLFQGSQNVLSDNVTHEIVPRKWAAAEPSQRAIEPPATRFVGRENLGFRIFGPTMQMNAKLDSGYVILHVAIKAANKFRRSSTYSIR